MAYSAAGMWFRSRSVRSVLYVVALAILSVRASDTHLHVCFDGQEPATTVHFADASVHDDEHHDGEKHKDKDVDPFVRVFVKSGDADSAAALPAGDLSLVILLPVDHNARPVVPDPAPLATESPFHLRPPMRGPPA